MSQNLLIIGASGRLGLALIRILSTHSTHPSIHAFLRTPSKLPMHETALCTSIQQGDALNITDISRSLKTTCADVVIVTIGVPDSTKPSTLRGDSAKTLVDAISRAFDNVKVVCISSIGAGGSSIKIGFGLGWLVKWRLWYLLRDHDVQEEILRKGLPGRVLVVRPTGLLDGKAKGRIVVFGNEDLCPSVSIDREEVAEFVMKEVCENGNFGKCVNVASVNDGNGVWGIKALFTLV